MTDSQRLTGGLLSVVMRTLIATVIAALTLGVSCTVSGPAGCDLVNRWKNDPSAIIQIQGDNYLLYSSDGELLYVVPRSSC